MATFASELKKLINAHFPATDHQAMTDALDTASEMVTTAHADPAAQGHAYRVFPDEDDPNFGLGGSSNDDGA